jgi:hypothetical protein
MPAIMHETVQPGRPTRQRERTGVLRCTFDAVAELTTDRRWKTFADVVAFALGTNVWISIVILPAIFVNTLHGAGLDLKFDPRALRELAEHLGDVDAGKTQSERLRQLLAHLLLLGHNQQ